MSSNLFVTPANQLWRQLGITLGQTFIVMQMKFELASKIKLIAGLKSFMYFQKFEVGLPFFCIISGVITCTFLCGLIQFLWICFGKNHSIHYHNNDDKVSRHSSCLSIFEELIKAKQTRESLCGILTCVSFSKTFRFDILQFTSNLNHCISHKILQIKLLNFFTVESQIKQCLCHYK